MGRFGSKICFRDLSLGVTSKRTFRQFISLADAKCDQNWALFGESSDGLERIASIFV